MKKRGLVLTVVLCSVLLAGLEGCTDKATTTTASSAISATMTVAPGPSTWTDLNPAGSVPLARADHSMVYDPATGKVILVGGEKWGRLGQ